MIVHANSIINDNNNTQDVKFWLGTQAEYDEITEKDSLTKYLIKGEATISELEDMMTALQYRINTLNNRIKIVSEEETTISGANIKITKYSNGKAHLVSLITEREYSTYTFRTIMKYQQVSIKFPDNFNPVNIISYCVAPGLIRTFMGNFNNKSRFIFPSGDSNQSYTVETHCWGIYS